MCWVDLVYLPLCLKINKKGVIKVKEGCDFLEDRFGNDICRWKSLVWELFCPPKVESYMWL